MKPVDVPPCTRERAARCLGLSCTSQRVVFHLLVGVWGSRRRPHQKFGRSKERFSSFGLKNGPKIFRFVYLWLWVNVTQANDPFQSQMDSPSEVGFTRSVSMVVTSIAAEWRYSAAEQSLSMFSISPFNQSWDTCRLGSLVLLSFSWGSAFCCLQRSNYSTNKEILLATCGVF